MWAAATGMVFHEYIGPNKGKQPKPEYKPTLQRWAELTGNVKQTEQRQPKTGDELAEEFFAGLLGGASA